MKKQIQKYLFGFTLVELIIVISIIAVLASLAFMALSGETAQARDSKRVSDIKTFEDAIATANGKNKKINYFVDNINGRANPHEDELETSTGIIQSLRGAYLLPMQSSIIDSDVLPAVSKDPKGSEYFVAFLSNTDYSFFASQENPDTKQPTALVRGTFQENAIIDVLTKSATSTGTTLTVSHPERFVFGDVIKVNDELMAVQGIKDQTEDNVSVSRGEISTTAVVHSDGASVKLIHSAQKAQSLVCLGSTTGQITDDSTGATRAEAGHGITFSLTSGFTAGETCHANANPVTNEGDYLPYKVN